MNTLEAISKRRSIRKYTTDKIEKNVADELRSYIEECNAHSGLNIQLYLDEPKAFDSFMAHYGSFRNVSNYISIVGKKGSDEAAGYFGEKVVLKATELGLATCWVALTYSKGNSSTVVGKDEKVYCVVALGYGADAGVPHKNKPFESLCTVEGTMPEWFKAGMDAALLAPTATNQQKFHISLKGNTVTAKAGLGFYTKLDLGIIKYHFEIGAGTGDWQWGSN